MISDSELFSKASQAAHDYRTVHGTFPEKIGIHYERLQSFPYQHIIFPERTELPMAVLLAESPPSFESLTYSRHMVMFEPVIGKAVEWDEVYLPVPWDEMKITTGTSLAFIVKMREQEVWERSHPDEVLRAIHAERKEEVDVCPDCYRHYLLMRKLHAIYPDWPPSVVPQCDYCKKQAKYHVRRSDWITFEKAEVK